MHFCFFKLTKTFSAFLFFMQLISVVEAQNLSKLDCAEVVLAEEDGEAISARPYLVYIFSSPGCGYCGKLKSDLSKQQISERIKVVYIEHDATIEKIKENAEKYAGHEVRTVTTCTKWFTLYFPITILVNEHTGKKIARYKGYYPDLWQKIEKKLK